MIKVRCVTNLNMLYFAGEEYEIPQEVYDAHPTCFVLIVEPENAVNVTVVFDENKMMNSDDIITKTADNITDTTDDNTADTPNLEEMSYADLKALADSKGIEYKHNISTVALIELLENN